MTDIAVGKALGSGRQAAVRARNHGAPITRRLETYARFQDEALADAASETVNAIRESVGAFPG